MRLIDFEGLNCYLNCIVSIAAHWKINYPLSFATLWSETDFTYNPKHQAYTTKRMLANLEGMGAKLNTLNHTDAEEKLRLLKPGEFIIVGMDAFYIPWSPIYQAIHDAHYFCAVKEAGGQFTCFDPTYGKEHLRITVEHILTQAFEICHMEQVAAAPLRIEVMEDARQIIRVHEQTEKDLLAEIAACKHENHKNADTLARYVTTLISNRHLYAHYLQNSLSLPPQQQFFNKEFFLRWQGIKNGLYKTSIIRNNEAVINEVCALLHTVFDEEIALAKQLITIA